MNSFLSATLLLLILMLYGCAEELPPPRVIEVVVDEVVLDQHQPIVRYVGRLQAKNDVAIQARVSGYLLTFDYREGDIVEAGTVLYTMDASEYEAAVARAKADLAGAVAQQANALRTYKRGLELVAKGAISQSEMDNFEAQKLDTDEIIEAAQAQLDSARVNLGYTTITAPITGRIGRSMASVGDLVGPTTGDLTSLVSIDPMEAQFQVSEATYLSRVAENVAQGMDGEAVQRIEVSLELTDGSIYPEIGRIDYIANRIDQTTGTLEARARFPNPRAVLVPGQYVRVLLQDAELAEDLFIPQAAVQADQQGSFVLIVDANGVVARRDVELEQRLDDKVIVTTGVNAGDQVIVRGLQQVRPGMTVTTKSMASLGQQD